jgi:hypothetical protein
MSLLGGGKFVDFRVLSPHPGKKPQYPLNMRLGGAEPIWAFAEVKSVLQVLGFDHEISSP